jgi:hypothetical protein|tara:strand:- start:1568 stop:2167 length:600 start_codon:yes stop_codon:yes gene_type:complete
MPFWSTNFGESTELKDPKRQFRFYVEFQGINAPQGGATLWYAKTAAKPSFTVEGIEHNYLNHVFKYPGKVTWADITVTLVDPVDPDMAATFADILVQSGYSPPTDSTTDSMGTISKAKAANALGTVIITQIDSNGDALEKWTLWNSFISDVKFGDSLAYGTDDLTEMSVTLKYDWARVQTYNDGSVLVAGDGGTEFFNV